MASDDLEARLRAAVDEAVMGQNLGPALASRIELAAQGELSRAGVRGARIRVRPQGRGFEVHVTLPPGPARVRELVLRIG